MKKLFLVFIVMSVIGLFAASSFGQENLPKPINGGVLNGKAISLPKPQYPEIAKNLGIGGAVSVEVTVDENGYVSSSNAVNFAANDDELSTERADAKAALRAAAEQAALSAKFSPTFLSGVPVKIKGIIVYNFIDGEGAADQSMPGGTASLNSKAIELPDPDYPDAAKAVRASGVVKVQVTIDENGNVIAARALSGHPLLQSAAVAAAQKARFEPFVSKEPVKIVGIVTYNFVLPEKQQ